MQDLKGRMAAHALAVAGFLQNVGATLIQCQAFEDPLRQFLVLAFRMTSGMAAAQVTTILEDLRGSNGTLGSLMKMLEKNTPIEQRTKDLLLEFLNERNWFIHHLEYQHGLDVFDPATLPPLLQRLDEIQQRSLHLQAEFAKLAIAYGVGHGITRESVDAEARRRLDKSIKPAT